MAGITIRCAFEEKKRSAATEACGAKSAHKLVFPVRGFDREKLRIDCCTIDDLYIYINNDRHNKALLQTQQNANDGINFSEILCM